MEAGGDDKRVSASDAGGRPSLGETEPTSRSAGRLIASAAAESAVWLVRQYQRFLRPLLGERCRFYPCCSEYFILSVRKYGLIRGGARGVARICRCHPFHPGGVDLP